ncbi:type IX secretion system motor protein PorM/GldM [Ochrovirga pacifica]|uniref:type IX secretion system motor protein PorM/GldM n=1 Tax=Ochrovirga pacifica TaxID=1042376 RepID=UPI000255A53B|nr:gliding motility protein GldM [Ochrovirga pacifica]
MAGGKLSPRQKMINLMYLVLMAMLALNVSAEVMDAFLKMFNRTEKAIEQGEDKNKAALADLKRYSVENPTQYKEVYQTGLKVKDLTDELVSELNTVKNVILEANPVDPETGELPVSKMDKGDLLDEYFFKGEADNPNAQRFVATVDKYREGMIALVGNNATLKNAIEENFDTTPVDGKPWLIQNFYKLPAIGSLAVLSSMESAALNYESEALSAFLSGRLKKAASATKLQAFVKLDKSTYSPGSEVNMEVFLASKDDSKVPNSVEINGSKIDLNKNFEDGKVKYKFRAGNVGDRPIVGKFIFKENGKDIPVEINSNYSVVAASNQAIVSAEKMNVVYRGLENPITITIPGISPTKVKASAPGLSQKSGTSYVMRPGTGKTVAIRVTGTADNGETVQSPPVEFRIKDIPQAMASIRKQYGSLQMPKSSLAKSTVEAGLPDFVFDLNLSVQSFKVKVPGKTTVVVRGNRMNAQAQKAISSARRGDIITIFGIRANIIGNSSYKLKEVLPISVEISN